MGKTRLLFKKEGRARYMSHLDLMRTMQRVFKRADVPLRHSEGFNPHPLMSIAMPLSVGAESVCELIDVELLSDMDESALPGVLNPAFPEGITILRAYTPEKKFAEIQWLAVTGTLIYDGGASQAIVDALSDYFAAEQIIISKRSKKGITDFDIIPGIETVSFSVDSRCSVGVQAMLTVQNPTLNPELLVRALQQNRQALAPDFATFTRMEVYDKDKTVFR